MKILKNDNPRWTEKHLQFISDHADSFGIYLSLEELEQEIHNINNDNASRRCSEDMLCFEIFNDDIEYVGDITLTLLDMNEHEIDILIFDEYAGHGYAGWAINMFCELYQRERIGLRLEGVIRAVNTYKEHVEKIFNRAQFNFQYEDDEGNKVYARSFEDDRNFT
ncbi:hypothetical protein ABEW61_02315 [Paenibacillus amylolyticus]|uniref:GNAT family N-acetyltransferase n=1 Tax=Paenibacillus amylolyticus TaxID=1451 RepID=UPI003D2C5907